MLTKREAREWARAIELVLVLAFCMFVLAFSTLAVSDHEGSGIGRFFMDLLWWIRRFA